MSNADKFERRISLENLLREAHLDRDTLIQLLKQNQMLNNYNQLDESKIQSIIQQAKKKQTKKDIVQETKDNDDSINDNNTNNNTNNNNDSHYKIIKNEFFNLRNEINKLENRMKLESHLNDIKQKKEYNLRIVSLKELSKNKKDIIVKYNKIKEKYDIEKELILLNINNIKNDIKNEVIEEENLLLKKIALQENVIKNEKKLENLLIQKKHFSEMKDISQFKPIAVFYVLKYLEINDFISSILCCKAWYFKLNKPQYFRILQRNIILRNKKKTKQSHSIDINSHELVSSETKLKRINHAVMQLKIDSKNKIKNIKNKKKISTPRPDDIYTQCMQQLQKVIAQSEQDREELEDRVKAQMGILKFMQTSMYNKMNELSKLRVRKWELKNKSNQTYQIEKKNLHKNIKNLEVNLNKNRLIIEHIKQNIIQQQQIREKKLKIQKDLRSVKSGTSNIQQTNELKKLKQQTKKLAQVIVKLRQEIPKRNQEVKKYKNRVELLESQYKQYSQQPLP